MGNSKSIAVSFYDGAELARVTLSALSKYGLMKSFRPNLERSLRLYIVCLPMIRNKRRMRLGPTKKPIPINRYTMDHPFGWMFGQVSIHNIHHFDIFRFLHNRFVVNAASIDR